MMQVATSSTPGSGHSYTEKARKHKDGSVLLSVADDRICKLNGVGALTWMVLEENPAGLSVDEVAGELIAQFDAINAEGQLHYEVSVEQLRSDTARFLTKMVDMNLLVIDVDSGGQQFYYIKDGVSGTTTSPATEFSSPRELPSETTQTDRLPLKRETFTAFVGLLAFDLLLKFRGFQSLIKRVENWPTAGPRTTDRELCKRVRAMVDRAQMYYPKKAMCLQHSAVVTCLLRRRGIPAEMVLAAQEFPPKGHAWAEVDGEVVNDTQRVKAKYLELRRV
jgi:hypothetical protein